MSKRLLRFLILITVAVFLGACDQIDTITTNTDVSQLTNAPFYIALQATVAQFQIPVIIAGLITLVAGWKLGRLGLAINGFIIGGLVTYTFLTTSGFILDANLMNGAAIAGGIIIGLLAYFLYGLMAFVIGGAIGMTLMNGAWLQIAENVPPPVLAFIITFISALVMFVVFRVFLVAFSAVIGAAILMLAVPFETLWAIPVAAVGIAIQTGIALWIKDDIFKNLRGDLGAALGEAFGEVLGPFSVLRERQRSDKDQPAQPKSSKAAPEARPAPAPKYSPPAASAPQNYRPAQPQQDYRPAQPQRPAPQQDYRPAQPQNPAPQQDYRPIQPQAPQPSVPQQDYRPIQPQNPAPQQDYRPVQPQTPNNPPAQPPVSPYQPASPQAQPPQPMPAFQREEYEFILPNGQTFPLVGSQMTMGRVADNHIVLLDPQVSSHHVICSIQPDGVVVWDNNSTNGTLLNGVPLTGSYRLTTSDVLQVGSVVVRLTRRTAP
jgi:hypothetical protein